MQNMRGKVTRTQKRWATHEQESASAFMSGGPAAAMPETFRLLRDPLSVRAASPTLVILVHRRRDATCTSIRKSMSTLFPGAAMLIWWRRCARYKLIHASGLGAMHL